MFVISHATLAVAVARRRQMRCLCNARVLHICVYMHNENHAASHTDGFVAVSPGKVFRPNTRIESQQRRGEGIGGSPVRKSEYHSVRTIKIKAPAIGGAGCTAFPLLLVPP